MSAVPVLIGIVILASATVAMALRNLIHSVLLLIVSWFGIAVFYLWAGAEFVAFAQGLVYVGAVSMVVLFAVLLTRRSRADVAVAPGAPGRASSAIIAAGAVGGVLAGAVMGTRPAPVPFMPARPYVGVRQLGLLLMGPQAAAVLVVGVILTVALLGAVVIAAAGRSRDREDGS